jgi:hypothetical protein
VSPHSGWEHPSTQLFHHRTPYTSLRTSNPPSSPAPHSIVPFPTTRGRTTKGATQHGAHTPQRHALCPVCALRLGRWSRQVRVGVRNKEVLVPFYELFTAPASQLLDRWFESDILKATLATDAGASATRDGRGFR